MTKLYSRQVNDGVTGLVKWNDFYPIYIGAREPLLIFLI